MSKRHSSQLKAGDRVMISARHGRSLGTLTFAKGNAGLSTYCKGKGSIIGFAPDVDFICYVLWDGDEEPGIARGINVGNLVHVRDVAREADHAQHKPNSCFEPSDPEAGTKPPGTSEGIFA